MSVIENAIKKLQASRGGSAARGRGADPASPEAARRSEKGPDTNTLSPAHSIAIDQEALRSAGLLAPLHQERELAQQFRQIKRPIINRALGRGTTPLAHGNVIMVTSAVAGEGKTFISLNLALSMRLEEDATVLLIDGDVVNPRISQALGVADAPGLLDIIREPSLSLSSVVLATDVKGLSFLPAGRPDANATELLASARMREVVDQLRGLDASRLVLFDSAPLLLTTESRALAEVVGQVLVVVRADLTPQHVVLEALHTLNEGKPVSLVLNQSTQAPHAGYYYPYGGGAEPQEPAGPA
jgi:exopolysaccharide/PEP-CTERM locus tyrosine autokinase